MRRFDEPIEVRHPLTEAMDDPDAMQFLWRGRLWKVRGVISRWRETGEWWRSGQMRALHGEIPSPGDPDAGRADSDGTRAPETETRAVETRAAETRAAGTRATETRAAEIGGVEADLLAEQNVWRVLATSGLYGADGVYELAQSAADGRWRLRAVVD